MRKILINESRRDRLTCEIDLEIENYGARDLDPEIYEAIDLDT